MVGCAMCTVPMGIVFVAVYGKVKQAAFLLPPALAGTMQRANLN